MNRTYSISANCTSETNDMEPGECLHHIREQRKMCKVYPDGNEFCYKFKDDVAKSDKSESTFGFNGQKRAVPNPASEIMPSDKILLSCGYYCSEKLGLSTIAPVTVNFAVSAPKQSFPQSVPWLGF